MKKRLLLLPVLTVTATAVAQSNFQAGYVVPLSGDTLRGEVDTRGELRGATLCRFRATPKTPPTEYKPTDVRAYGFAAGGVYRALALPTAAPTLVFMQVLAEGKLSLVRYTDETEAKHYYAQTTGSALLQPLVQRDTTVLQINPQTRVEHKVSTRVYAFRNVLWQLMADCPAVQTKLPGLELLEAQLTKTVAAYNSCVGGPQRTITQRTGKLLFSVSGGAYHATATYQDGKSYDLTSDFLASVGAGVQIHPAYFSPHLSFVGELWYTQQKYSLSYEAEGTLGAGYQRTLDVQVASIGVPVLLRYSLTQGGVRPYVQAGFVYKQNIQRDAEKTDYLPRLSSAPSASPVELKSYNIGGVFGVGVSIPTGSYGSINLEGRLDKLDNTSAAANTISGSQGIALLASYTFGR
ncbi:PorT family protein [Hymenobacter sp. HSC-4F20]|uniref:porin family protein n=1 Tax=Hymenobacter sp. HSC-4F20 TaxID=2864135 RepID=UPI001C72CD7A|nr:porin family protein [Hymenobacter sp. HSC-4F20]MBX0290828.1 PorT family protein [Hymenobacter sp. HSC-4F20]